MCRVLIPRSSESLEGWQGWQMCLPDFKTGRRQFKTRMLFPPQYPSVIIFLSGCPPFAIGIQSASKGPPSMSSPFLDEIVSGNSCFPLFFFLLSSLFLFFFFLPLLPPSPFLSTAHPDVTLNRYAGGSHWDFPLWDNAQCLLSVVFPVVSQPPAMGVTRSFPPVPWSAVSVVFQALESLSPLRSPKPDLVGDHTRVSLDERGMYGMFFNEQFMKFLSYMFRKFFKLKSTNISPRKLEFTAAQMQALVFKNVFY